MEACRLCIWHNDPIPFFMKRFLYFTVIVLLLFTGTSSAWYMSAFHNKHSLVGYTTAANTVTATLKDKLLVKAVMARRYAVLNHFNTRYCFLADMSIESGKQRFFVYDLKNNTVIKNGLVTHGRCNQNWLTGRKYGNSIGCGCTSLGRYKVGNAYQGRFGLAYKLYGLDATNSNAYNRFVVLHSMECVPEKDVIPYPVCQSDGCPAVSPGFLRELSLLINNSREPVLLWIFE